MRLAQGYAGDMTATLAIKLSDRDLLFVPRHDLFTLDAGAFRSKRWSGNWWRDNDPFLDAFILKLGMEVTAEIGRKQFYIACSYCLTVAPLTAFFFCNHNDFDRGKCSPRWHIKLLRQRPDTRPQHRPRRDRADGYGFRGSAGRDLVRARSHLREDGIALAIRGKWGASASIIWSSRLPGAFLEVVRPCV